MQWFKFYFDNYFGSFFVRKLSLANEACYLRLIIALYQEGGKIPNDPKYLKQIFKTSDSKRCQKILNVLIQRFKLIDGYITHDKVTYELASADVIRTKRVEAGRKGGEAKVANAKAIQKKEERIKNTENIYINKIPDLVNEDAQDKLHPDTYPCWEIWVDKRGLQPDFHYNDMKRTKELKQIDEYVLAHGKDKVVDAIKKSKVTKIGYALNPLDSVESDNLKKELVVPKVDHDKVKELMAQM